MRKILNTLKPNVNIIGCLVDVGELPVLGENRIEIVQRVLLLLDAREEKRPT